MCITRITSLIIAIRCQKQRKFLPSFIRREYDPYTRKLLRAAVGGIHRRCIIYSLLIPVQELPADAVAVQYDHGARLHSIHLPATPLRVPATKPPWSLAASRCVLDIFAYSSADSMVRTGTFSLSFRSSNLTVLLVHFFACRLLP